MSSPKNEPVVEVVEVDASQSAENADAPALDDAVVVQAQEEVSEPPKVEAVSVAEDEKDAVEADVKSDEKAEENGKEEADAAVADADASKSADGEDKPVGGAVADGADKPAEEPEKKINFPEFLASPDLPTTRPDVVKPNFLRAVSEEDGRQREEKFNENYTAFMNELLNSEKTSHREASYYVRIQMKVEPQNDINEVRGKQVFSYSGGPPALAQWAALVSLGNDRLVRFLVENTKSREMEWPPNGHYEVLRAAVLSNNYSTVLMLLRHGFYPLAEDFFGNTPLHIAASSNAKNSIRAYYTAGVPLDKENKRGATPLDVAAELCQEDAVHTLVRHGVNPKKALDKAEIVKAFGDHHKKVFTLMQRAHNDYQAMGAFVLGLSRDIALEDSAIQRSFARSSMYERNVLRIIFKFI